MNWQHQLFFLKFIKLNVIFQFIFISAHIAFSLILKPISNYFSRRKKRILIDARDKIRELIEKERPWPKGLFSHKLCKIPFLVPLVLNIDKENQSEHWMEMRKSLFTNILFPKAKKLTYTKKWTKKIQAIACFFHFPNSINEKEILHLLKDTTPVIKYSAAACAAKLGTSAAANAIIDEMNCNRFLRFPFRESLLKGNPKSFSYIEERLEKDKDPWTRVSCLEVLSYNMNSHIVDLAKRDLHASHKNLRIAAIRAISHYLDPVSNSLLIPLLKDSEWEVRAVSARCLGYLKAKEAIDELAFLLTDKSWWVRINSALALKRLGEDGIQVLKQQNIEKDRFAYEAAQYALTLDIDDGKNPPGN